MKEHHREDLSKIGARKANNRYISELPTVSKVHGSSIKTQNGYLQILYRVLWFQSSLENIKAYLKEVIINKLCDDEGFDDNKK
jgi:hypothetical protein